jgi:hypothetical protein
MRIIYGNTRNPLTLIWLYCLYTLPHIGVHSWKGVILPGVLNLSMYLPANTNVDVKPIWN